jgi:hypothetical protein
VTLPVLAYRGIWTVFGLRYLPYQVLAVALHLTAAVLLRVIMRRAGVGPWLSTATAAVFEFFGAGAENILVAFQIAFVGALVFGLTHLILADHDGPLDRRDGFGLLAGFCGLMCSSVAISMVVAVGIAVLLRRGRRVRSCTRARLLRHTSCGSRRSDTSRHLWCRVPRPRLPSCGS